MKKYLVRVNVLLMVANFAFWVASGNPLNITVALFCGTVAIILVRWGR